MAELSDFGQPLSYEGKAIESHRSGQKHRGSGETAAPEADRGKHQTGGIDARSGKPWTKIKSGLGFGLHRMADTHYEIPVVVPVTPASSSEPLELRTLLRETIEHSPGNGPNAAMTSVQTGGSTAVKPRPWCGTTTSFVS